MFTQLKFRCLHEWESKEKFLGHQKVSLYFFLSVFTVFFFIYIALFVCATPHDATYFIHLNYLHLKLSSVFDFPFFSQKISSVFDFPFFYLKISSVFDLPFFHLKISSVFDLPFFSQKNIQRFGCTRTESTHRTPTDQYGHYNIFW